MEWLETLYLLIFGLVLRLALPLLITVVIIVWLRSLDARWQREADEYARAVGKPSFWEGRTPCWDVKGCTPENRAKCPVFLNGHTACWQVLRQPDGQLREECLGCELFQSIPVVTPA